MSGRVKADENREATDPASYEVGYGRPPRHSRFKPGQSGNPKGRPKGSKSLKTLLEDALSSPITITECGVPKKIALQELLFKAMVGKAVKGDARSTALLVKLMEQFGLSKPDGSENTPLIVEIVRFGEGPLPSDKDTGLLLEQASRSRGPNWP
jgi:hypothetical protein